MEKNEEISNLVSETKRPEIENLEILGVLGRGAFATVYKARQKTLDRLVAVKVFSNAMFTNASAKERFNREAKIGGQLEHPNIAGFYGSGVQQSGDAYLILEFVEGKTLDELLREEAPLSYGRILEIFLPLFHALEFAHKKGLVHRDIKPSNIMLQKADANKFIVKLLDFGIAKAYCAETEENGSLTKTGVAIGSPAYMSPEQCTGKKADARSDLYSCACILYQSLFKTLPFESSEVLELMQAHVASELPSARELSKKTTGVPETLSSLVLRALDKSPEKRPQSAAEFAGLLEKELLGLPADTRPELKKKDRNAGPAVFIGLALLAIATSVFLVFRQARSLNTNKDFASVASESTLEQLRQQALRFERLGQSKEALQTRERELESLLRKKMPTSAARNQAINDAWNCALEASEELSKFYADRALKLARDGLNEASRSQDKDEYYSLLNTELKCLERAKGEQSALVRARSLLKSVKDSSVQEKFRMLGVCENVLIRGGCAREAEELESELLNSPETKEYTNKADILLAQTSLVHAIVAQGDKARAKKLAYKTARQVLADEEMLSNRRISILQNVSNAIVPDASWIDLLLAEERAHKALYQEDLRSYERLWNLIAVVFEEKGEKRKALDAHLHAYKILLKSKYHDAAEYERTIYSLTKMRDLSKALHEESESLKYQAEIDNLKQRRQKEIQG